MQISFIDIEFTHDDVDQARIIDIAIDNVGGTVESFATDVNPEAEISSFKAALTGLNKESSKRAPKFFQLAKRIVQLTEGRILIGHRMEHQYTILTRMFSELGFPFQREWLDLNALVGSSFPELKNKELHHIAKQFKIEYLNIHRSEEDVKLVRELFRKMTKLIREDHVDRMIHGYLPEEYVEVKDASLLSDEAGFFTIYNAQKHAIYTASSRNIRQRVNALLRGEADTIALRNLQNEACYIWQQEEGNEMIGMVKANAVLDQRRPIYNTSNSKLFTHSIVTAAEDGITHLKVIDEVKPESLASFTSLEYARSSLSKLLEDNKLCPLYCDMLPDFEGPCYNYLSGSCKGICVEEEAKTAYNKRVGRAVDDLKFRHLNYIVVDRGRTNTERSLLWVEGGKFVGAGYIKQELISKDLPLMKDFIEPYEDSKFIRQLIKNYVLGSKVDQVIQF